MLSFNVPVTVIRVGDDGQLRRFEAKAVVDPSMLLLPVDADIEDGDVVERALPSGKTAAMVITKVDVLRSPFGRSALDHTEATYTSAVEAVAAAGARQAAGPEDSTTVVDPDTLRQRRMLLWLAERIDGIYGFEELYAGDGEAPLARRDVESLDQQGLVRPAVGGGSSLGTVQAGITPAGRQRAAELASDLRDRSRRNWACREGLLKWLYLVDAADSAGRARVVTDFLHDDLSIFVAERFAAAEVDRAAGWLERQNLIAGPRVDEAEGPIKAYLLDSGVRCLEDYDSDIRRYREAMSSSGPAPSPGPVFNVSATNVQVATGDRSQQSMSVTQVPEQLVHVIEGIAEILTALGLVTGRESELQDLRGSAIADVTSNAPTAGAVRRFREWVIGCVKQGGTAAAVAAVTAASNGMLHDAEALVHALGG